MKNKRIALVFSFCFIISINILAQSLNGTVKDSVSHKALDFVSVVVMNEKKQPICFQHTNQQGRFHISIPEGKQAHSITFTFLGYAKKNISFGRYKNGQTVFLSEAVTSIKEVTVKANRLQLQGDTLSYSVAGFKQKQDRSIADVITKMPGLNVGENGSITYQGKPINKFYIEGLDLMGSKYAMASENLAASKVKKVQVLQRHQPIKALKGKSFSDQAAINLVLSDDAKEAWTGNMTLGLGAQLQNGEGEDLLRNGKLSAMMFSKKIQSLTMYKCNNTGTDIQHEVQDLAQESSLNDDGSAWINSISTGNNSLAQNRYTFNDTHLLATNWLSRLGKDESLRLQATYLFDNITGKKYNETVYLNILGKPAIEEESQASKYRSELNTEVQYKLNSTHDYISNIFHSSFRWNHASATSLLNKQPTKQYERLHKTYVGNEFKMLHNLSRQRSFSFQADAYYQSLPNLLALLDTRMQRLNIEKYELDASSTFRHKLWGMNISYLAELNYWHEKATFGIRNDIEENRLDTEKKCEYMQELDGSLTPTITFANTYGFGFTASSCLKLARFDMSHDSKSKFYVSPTIKISYKITSTTDATVGYRHICTVPPFSTLTSLSYYSDFITQMSGNGKWNDIAIDKYWGEFNFGNPVNGLFFHIAIDYDENRHLPLYENWLEGNIYHMKTSDKTTNSSRKNIKGYISKALGMGKFTINIGGDATYYNFERLASDELVAYQNRYLTSYIKFAVMPSHLFSIEEKSEYRYSKQLNKQDSSLDNEALRTMQHALRLILMPGKWQIEWSNCFYHSSDKSIDAAFFSDASIAYKPKRYEISMNISNIFGSKKYERRTITDNYIYYSINHLRPREILCNLTLYL